ncbi:hypothetical protein ACTXT7_010066 [Hymenolepis weldensis]
MTKINRSRGQRSLKEGKGSQQRQFLPPKALILTPRGCEAVSIHWKESNALSLSAGSLFLMHIKKKDSQCPISGRRPCRHFNITQVTSVTKFFCSHRGVSSKKSIARTFVYWSGMEKDIEEAVQKCSKCQQATKLLPHSKSCPLCKTAP